MSLPWFWDWFVDDGHRLFFFTRNMLAIANISFVSPVTALNYVVGALGGKFFLGESVTRQRWAGVALVCIGVVLVLLSVAYPD